MSPPIDRLHLVDRRGRQGIAGTAATFQRVIPHQGNIVPVPRFPELESKDSPS